jgi:hypothetical protein
MCLTADRKVNGNSITLRAGGHRKPDMLNSLSIPKKFQIPKCPEGL